MAHRSTPARRHRLQDLTRTIKLAGGDREAELALGRALGLVRTPDGDLEMAPPAAVSPRDAARRIAVEAAEQEAADEAAALAGPATATREKSRPRR